MSMEVSRRPNVEAWYARLKARPAARQILSLPVT
jgi:glutathione S-transferase